MQKPHMYVTEHWVLTSTAFNHHTKQMVRLLPHEVKTAQTLADCRLASSRYQLKQDCLKTNNSRKGLEQLLQEKKMITKAIM